MKVILKKHSCVTNLTTEAGQKGDSTWNHIYILDELSHSSTFLLGGQRTQQTV